MKIELPKKIATIAAHEIYPSQKHMENVGFKINELVHSYNNILDYLASQGERCNRILTIEDFDVDPPKSHLELCGAKLPCEIHSQGEKEFECEPCNPCGNCKKCKFVNPPQPPSPSECKHCMSCSTCPHWLGIQRS